MQLITHLSLFNFSIAAAAAGDSMAISTWHIITKFAKFLAKMNFKYGLHPLAHLQICEKIERHLFSNFKGEAFGVSNPSVYFKSYTMQTLLLPFNSSRSNEYYDLIIPSLGIFFETYYTQAEQILGIKFNSSEKGRDLLSAIQAMRNGSKEFNRYWRQKGVVNIDEELIASNFIGDIFKLLRQAAVHKVSLPINFDYYAQKTLEKKWLELEDNRKIDYYTIAFNFLI